MTDPSRTLPRVIEDNAERTTKGARTRARIVAVATRLFDERGYHGTSLQEVAEAAGISKATIYHHFKTKDEILVGIFQGLIRSVVTRQRDRRRDDTRTAAQMLRSMIGDLLELIEQNPSHLRVFVEQARLLPPGVQDELSRERQGFQGELRDVLETGAATGEFTLEGDPDLVAAAVLGACWTYYWFPPQGGARAQDLTTVVTTLVLRGLLPRSETEPAD